MNLFEQRITNIKGQADFSESSWDTPFIKNILHVFEHIGIPTDKIIESATENIQQTEESHSYAPKLMKTMYQNRVESALFQTMEKHLDPTIIQQAIGAPKFSKPMMQRLLNEMATTNDGEFFPLRSVMEKRTLKHPLLEYSDEHPSYQDITTAAATPNGNFIFNRNFMQSLINWAVLKEVKPTSSYFKSNGGTIPDAYCYAEFVLAHELLHYTHSDFHRQHYIQNPKHKVINYVADLRSNYILVKSGYSQLPMGLYSDEFNFDKYRDFSKMYEDVLAELKKLPQSDQDMIEEWLEKQANDSHEEGQAEGATGEQAGKAANVSEGTANKHSDKQNDAVKEGKKQADKPKDPGDPKYDPKATSDGQPGTGTGQSQVIDTSMVKPTISWKQIIAKFVSSAKQYKDKSYSKVSRRSAATALSVSKYGAGAIQKGDVKFEEEHTNLVVVLDLSGSMGGAAAKVLVEVTSLVSKHFPRADFYIIAFSGDAQLYRCNVSKNTAMKINNMNETKGPVTPLKQLLTTYEGGGTVFKSVVGPVMDLLHKQYNMLLLTDSDIIGGDNLQEFSNLLMSHRKLLNIILASQRDFQAVAKALPIIPNNITYLT